MIFANDMGKITVWGQNNSRFFLNENTSKYWRYFREKIQAFVMPEWLIELRLRMNIFPSITVMHNRQQYTR